MIQAIVVLLLAFAQAQDPSQDPTTGVGEAPAGAALSDPAEVQRITLEIAKGLRCPVCQGLSVADSSSDAAVAMKDRIEEMVGAGYTEDQIVSYFVARYGTWVLLEPPQEGLNVFIFVAPGVLVGLGLLGWAVSGRKRRPPDAAPVAADAEDPYKRRVLDELEG